MLTKKNVPPISSSLSPPNSWHLTTSAEQWTGLDFIQSASFIYKAKPTYFLLKPWMLKITGLFDKTIRELIEMQYQNDQNYFFDSSGFCQAFNFSPTSYEQGIKEVMGNGGHTA